MSLLEPHLLSYLLLIPLASALLVALVPSSQTGLIRWLAISGSLLVLFLSLFILSVFNTSLSELQFYEHRVWNSRLGTSYSVGIDGLSLPMVVLTAVLSFVALLASAGITTRQKGYYFLMLLLEAAILGVFIAQDWALFYVFWEMTLIPLFFLIDRWGGQNRQMAALNFVLYTLGGSVFMLLSLLVLFDYVPSHSFSMIAMNAAARELPEYQQILIFLGLLIGFGVKMPIFPLHGWLPLAHVEAPTPVSIMLSGILLKMGAYGVIRATAMLPEAIVALQGVLALLGLFCVLYGGLLAWRQRDLKKLIAYSSISHMGIVLLGIATLNSVGLSGAILQMVAHGLIAGCLFMLIGLLYERTHSRDIGDYSSILNIAPRFSLFLIIAFVALFAMPGTIGFIAEIHVIIGSFQRWGLAAIVISLGVIISAVYSIRTLGRLVTGPTRGQMKDLQDLHPSEVIAAVILVAGIIILGLFPAPLLDLSVVTVDQIIGGLSWR